MPWRRPEPPSRRAEGSPPYAEGGDAALNPKPCVGRGALTPPRIPYWLPFHAVGALIERPPPRRSALASLFEGGGTAKGRDGRSPSRRSARIDMVCTKIEVPARADVGIGPYAKEIAVAPNPKPCVGRGALTPPRIPDAEPMGPARADVGIGPYENCGAMCVNENASRAAARTVSE